MGSVVAEATPSSQEAEIFEAVLWVKAHKTSIPPCVYNVVQLVAFFRIELDKSKSRATNLLDLFRRQMGLLPKSEKGKKPEPVAKTDAKRLAELKARRAKLLAEIRRYEDRLGKGRKKRQKKRAGSSSDSAAPLPVPGPDTSYERSTEAVFTGCMAQTVEDSKVLAVNKINQFENPRGLHSVQDDRVRYEHSVTTKTIHLKVETVTDPRTGKSVTASTDEIGPPNSQSTWAGIANTIIAVIGYAIPINRLALMLEKTCPYFSSTRICSYLKMAAELFLPIYNCLGEQDLPQCDVLQGDDTKGVVIEIQRDLKKDGQVKEPREGSLIAKVADIFGRVFDKKKGEGKKQSLNITVVIGKTVVSDPRSYIFFFRTHLGSFGDLLTKILENRSPKNNKKITIISDLATTNLASTQLYEKFEITHAGCGAHARRPFWRHKKKDEKLCYWMLSAFLVLEQIEDQIDDLGRNKERIIRYRQRYSRKVWEIILKRCESVLRGEKAYGYSWPKNSELYKACRYIVKNYEALTRYIWDPRLPSNNNLSERVLRWDKIMQDSSKFRMTEAGRLHIDILRTITHTCSAAKVELKDYLLFIFKNRLEIEDNPKAYTPYAFALKQDAIKAVGQPTNKTLRK